jgi:hypothetical protein
MQIKSQTLVVDFEPILDELLWPKRTYQPYSWDLVGAGAQAAIDATMSSLLEAYKDFEMSNEDTLRDLSPRASTKTTFNAASTLGLFPNIDISASSICRRPSILEFDDDYGHSFARDTEGQKDMDLGVCECWHYTG